MKSSDIVNRLALKLPKLSDEFTDNVAVSSLTHAAGVATVVTSQPHGLKVSDQVFIHGAKTPIAIASIVRTGTVGTVVTVSDHDATEGYPDSIEIEGCADPEFNGTFTIISVDNRKTINFSMLDAGPLTTTGGLVINCSSYLQTYNGLYPVASVPDPTTFTYNIPDPSVYSPASGTIEARKAPRITALLDNEDIARAYTKQSTSDKLWGIVVTHDVNASRSRNTNNDAVADNEIRQQLIEGVTFYVVFKCSDYIAARQARDHAEDMLPLICKVLLGYKPPTTLSNGGTTGLQFDNHFVFGYNGAYYIHGYTFQRIVSLYMSDQIPDDYENSVAFRDLDGNITFTHGTGIAVMTADLNLDDVPL